MGDLFGNLGEITIPPPTDAPPKRRRCAAPSDADRIAEAENADELAAALSDKCMDLFQIPVGTGRLYWFLYESKRSATPAIIKQRLEFLRAVEKSTGESVMPPLVAEFLGK